MERRVLKFHVRAKEKLSGAMVVSGYAARYNQLSHPLPDGMGGQFRERISKGAFNRVVRGKGFDCVALFNHDANKILGRTTSGTLDLEADDDGLAFTLDLPDTSSGRDAYTSVQRGDINGCSFAFSVGDDDQDWNNEDDPDTRRKTLVRSIRNFQSLTDISICTSPAYPGTSVDARGVLVGAEVRSFLMTRANSKRRRLPPGKSMQDMVEEERNRQNADAAAVARRKAFLHSIL